MTADVVTLRQAHQDTDQYKRVDGVSNARLSPAAHGHDTDVTELTEEMEERKRLEEQTARKKQLEAEALQLGPPALRTLPAGAEQPRVPPFATMKPADAAQPPFVPMMPAQAQFPAMTSHPSIRLVQEQLRRFEDACYQNAKDHP